jgi:hypothetical protein
MERIMSRSRALSSTLALAITLTACRDQGPEVAQPDAAPRKWTTPADPTAQSWRVPGFQTGSLIAQNTGVTIVSLVGDMDNFGYGGGANPPCVFYDLSDPVTDLGIFDRELTSGDAVDSWTHDFRGDPNFGAGFNATSVLIELPEKFSDFTASTLDIDGTTVFATPNGFSRCGPFILQTFLFTGAAAAFANDGVINITFRENGDDIVFDYSKITIMADVGVSGQVNIDIRPGRFPNRVDPRSTGWLPVAVLSDAAFDPATVDPETITLGDGIGSETSVGRYAGRLRFAYEDLNGDGVKDLLVWFRIPDLVANGDLDFSTTSLTLNGKLNDGTSITGSDSVAL